MATTEKQHQPGDEIDIDGVVVILGTRKGNNGIRWTWTAPELDVDGMTYRPTAEDAIADARRKLAAPRCPCGELAEMTASTGPTCANCYDNHAG